MILYHGSNVGFRAVARERKLSPIAAMAVVYGPSFYKMLQDPETGLYCEPPSHLLNLFNAKRKRRTVRK